MNQLEANYLILLIPTSGIHRLVRLTVLKIRLIMRLLLDVKDDKAAFFMEMLKNFSFVKAKPLSNEKAVLMEDIKEAVENLKLVREGKIKARPARELLDEL